jgi:Zn-dependent protease with chaperone function
LEKEKNDRVQQVGALFELISGWIIDGLNLCNSRSHELESDRYGMLLMFDAGIKPAAAIWLQEFFNTHHQGHDHKSLSGKFLNLFSTHPAPGERLEANRKTLEEINKAPLK